MWKCAKRINRDVLFYFNPNNCANPILAIKSRRNNYMYKGQAKNPARAQLYWLPGYDVHSSSKAMPKTYWALKSDYKILWCCIISHFINCRDLSTVIRSASQQYCFIFLHFRILLLLYFRWFYAWLSYYHCYCWIWLLYDVSDLRRLFFTPFYCLFNSKSFSSGSICIVWWCTCVYTILYSQIHAEAKAYIIWHVYWWSTAYRTLAKWNSKISNHCLWNVKHFTYAVSVCYSCFFYSSLLHLLFSFDGIH